MASRWPRLRLFCFLRDVSWMFQEASWMLLIPEFCLPLGACTVFCGLLAWKESCDLYKRFPICRSENLCHMAGIAWLSANNLWMIGDCTVDEPGNIPWRLAPMIAVDMFVYGIIKNIAGAGCLFGILVYLYGIAIFGIVPRLCPAREPDKARRNCRIMLLSTSTATRCLKDFLWSRGILRAALVVDCATAVALMVEAKVEQGHFTPLTLARLMWVLSNAIWLLIELCQAELRFRLVAAGLVLVSGMLVTWNYVRNCEVDDDNTLTAAVHDQAQDHEPVLPLADKCKVRVAIIGAGPSGLSALWAFKDALNPLDNVEIVCFEKSDCIGGQWSFDPSIPRSSQTHTSMYKDLCSNGPKEAGSEYLDYSYLEHFGRPIPSCPPRDANADYIRGRAKKYDLTNNIRFNMDVTSVTWDEHRGRFQLCAKNCDTGLLAGEDFHFVIVANGHHSVPHIPKFAGFETFPGEVLHSKDFRDARRFKGKRILAIGGSLSAEDVALQCCKFGATSITITSQHPMGYAWPVGISEVPQLTRVSGHTVHFLDGTQEDVDVIVICTGYEYSFPFLTPELKTNAKNTLVIEDLYKGVFFIERPELMYLGIQNQVYTFLMLDLQAMLARLAVSNKFVVPAKQNMVEDIHVWIQKQDKLDAVKDWHALQTEYLKELNSLVMLGDDKDILCQQMFDQAEDDKVKDILQFRNGSFASCFSGAQGVNPPAPWLESTEEVPLQEYLESLGSVDFTADEPPLDSALVTFPAKKHDLAEGNTQACPQPLHPAPVAAAVPDFPAAVQVEAVAASPACVPLQAIPAPPDRGTSAETDPPEVLKQSSQGKSRTGKAKGKARGNK
mmetsp:Transcript_162194/g.515323  ORF Transcript_162194/g.515323 Transcript_162194/m.515323 type:complete len:838 (+) Transcript_162194:58-2571(+)